jgi:hypothetical protein
MRFVVALVGIALAIGMLRALLRASPPPSMPALAAVGVALLLTFQAVANLEGSVSEMFRKYERFAPQRPSDALEAPSVRVGIDPPFTAWAAGNLRRGETFALLEPFPLGADHWLAYRLVPNTLARDRESADWLVFFNTPDPYATHRLRRTAYVRLSWGPDAGLLRRTGAR